MINLQDIWSNTDFPYMCIKDEKRTIAFRKAIKNVVKPGDIVIDAGAGSGILSFFAAESGARKVYAVEIDAFLAQQLEKSIKANGFSNIIEVVRGDIQNTNLPAGVDVVISEIIDTGLIEELQVPVINDLVKRGIITSKTQIVPDRYDTYFQLVNTDNLYYGYQIFAPKHEWPYYSKSNSGWIQTKITPVSNKMLIASIDFSSKYINALIDKENVYSLTKNLTANAIRISGVIRLCKDMELGATNALNGDKIISILPVTDKHQIKLKIKYRMGAGLHSLSCEVAE